MEKMSIQFFEKKMLIHFFNLLMFKEKLQMFGFYNNEENGHLKKQHLNALILGRRGAR